MIKRQLFRSQSKPFIFAVGLLLVLLLGVFDAIIGSDMSTTVFYLAPIVIVAWFAGRPAGIVIAIASMLVAIGGDWLTGAQYRFWFIPVWNIGSRLCIHLLIIYFVALLRARLAEVESLARTDPLTRLANRRHFFELADFELNKASRYMHPLTVAYFDLDNFKTINDHFGHHVGDLLLQEVADTLRGNLRKTDLVARLGGDEFVVLLPETAPEAAVEVIERLRVRLNAAMQSRQWPVTFSIGMLTFFTLPITVDEMLNQVDHLMYTVKTSSKDALLHRVVGEFPAQNLNLVEMTATPGGN